MQKDQIEKYIKICNEDPCHQSIGLNAVHLDEAYSEIELVLKPTHLNFENCVHGGILSFLLDTTMGFCVYPHLTVQEKILAVDLKVSYLKAALLEMGKIKVTGEIVSRTRRLAVSEGEVRSPDGDILVKGMGTYAVLKAGD